MKRLEAGQSLQDIVHEKPIVIIEIGSIRCCACSAISQKLEAHFKEDEMVVCYSVSLKHSRRLQPTWAFTVRRPFWCTLRGS